MPSSASRRSHYQEQIAKVTHAPDEYLPILEKIMREEIFHSTLDWQTRSQFNAGARQAKRLFMESSFLYVAEYRMNLAVCRRFMAEGSLARAQSAGDTQVIADAEAELTAAQEAQTEAIAGFNRISGLNLSL